MKTFSPFLVILQWLSAALYLAKKELCIPMVGNNNNNTNDILNNSPSANTHSGYVLAF